jgi:hypothetical protein
MQDRPQGLGRVPLAPLFLSLFFPLRPSFFLQRDAGAGDTEPLLEERRGWWLNCPFLHLYIGRPFARWINDAAAYSSFLPFSLTSHLDLFIDPFVTPSRFIYLYPFLSIHLLLPGPSHIDHREPSTDEQTVDDITAIAAYISSDAS